MENPSDDDRLHSFLWDSYTTVRDVLGIGFLFGDVSDLLSDAKEAWKRQEGVIIEVKEKVHENWSSYQDALVRAGLTGKDL